MRRELDDCATRFHVGPNDISLPHFCSPSTLVVQDYVADGDFEQSERVPFEFGSQPL